MSVLVIGGGPAGCVAAHRLARLGHDITLVEVGADVGGRTRTLRERGFTIDLGTTSIFSFYRRTRALLPQLGLADQAVLARQKAIKAMTAFVQPEVLVVPAQVAARLGQRIQLGGRVIGLRRGLEVVGVSASASGRIGVEVSQGGPRQGVVLGSDLSPDLRRNNMIGLKRFRGGRIAAADRACDTPHLISEQPVSVDGNGPYAMPAGPCGYGRVVETSLPLAGGGLPVGASFADGVFVLSAAPLRDSMPSRSSSR